MSNSSLLQMDFSNNGTRYYDANQSRYFGEQMTTKVFARGLNRMGQLGIQNKRQDLSQFVEVPSLRNRGIKQIEGHFSQSACLLDDNQILYWGYVMDTLTTARTLSYFKRFPKLARYWQDYAPVGSTLGMRLGNDAPELINKDLVFEHRFRKISVGGAFVLALTDLGDLYGVGENYKGQLGLGDIKFKHKFTLFPKHFKSKIIDVAAGYQHSIIITEQGECYGFGRTNWQQYIPDQLSKKTTVSNKKCRFSVTLSKFSIFSADYYQNPQKFTVGGESVLKVAAGFSHSLFLTKSGNIYAVGLNNHGQCGKSNLIYEKVSTYEPIYVELQPGEKIIDISTGKSHNLLLTDQGNVFCFGASFHGQMGRKIESAMDICSPQQMELPLKAGEKPVKIKGGFDKSVVITDRGNAYLWGGEDWDIEKFPTGISRINDLLEEQDLYITDVGLGFMHTLVATKSRKVPKRN